MVKKLISFLYRESNTLNQAALYLGLFAFLSQLLAFLRDRLLAHIFGAGAELDIYYAAFRVPDLIFVTIASIVSISVLIPFIVEKESLGKEKLREFINGVFSFFGILITIVSVAAYILMPSVSQTIFKGLPPESLESVVSLSRLLLLSPIFLGFSNLFGSVTQAYNRFAVYALAPLLYNAGIIGGVMFLADKMGVMGVAWGVVIGAAIHMLVQVPYVASSGLFPKPTLNFDASMIARVVRISLPRTITLAMSSLVLIFLISLASLMNPGSISVLSFSTNLMSVPLSLIGVSYSLAAFPTLSRRFQEKKISAFLEQMADSTRFIIFWTLPLTVLIIVLRAQIVRVVLGSGLFDWNDTRLTAAALALFVFSSVFQCLMLLFMRGFYSAGITRKPFYINLFSTLAVFASAYGLVKLFYASDYLPYFVGVLLKVEDIPGTVVLMLPAAFSIGTIINGIILWAAFEREFRGFTKGLKRMVFEVTGTSLIMGAAAYVSLDLFDNFLNTATFGGLLLQGLMSGLVSIVLGALVLIALKNKEVADVWRVIRGKFSKPEVIATDPEIV